MQDESVIKLQNVWKKYDMEKSDPLVVLRDINLDIKKGEFVAITGPSGSGKSTMMHIVGALDIPSWGKVYLNGKNIAHLSESSLAYLRGKTIGFIFQDFNLLPNLSALENVALPMEIINEPEKASKERAKKLLEELGLGNRLHHEPNQLSGGEQQRVAIARALSNDPEVILADEPTGNLDSKTGQFVMDFLEKMNDEGKTIVIITHDLGLVSYAKKVIYIKDGKIEKEEVNKKKKVKL